jgi:hypothetical protein
MALLAGWCGIERMIAALSHRPGHKARSSAEKNSGTPAAPKKVPKSGAHLSGSALPVRRAMWKHGCRQLPRHASSSRKTGVLLAHGPMLFR